MSSSTSSSDPAGAAPTPPEARAWRGALIAGALTALGAVLVLFGLLLALDPYDTGRFALVSKPGALLKGPRFAHASRGRDPAFDGAILGNSHVQLLSPERLTAATGLPFVSLIVPGTRPREQLALLDWYLAHRARPPAALVLGLDAFWCSGDPALPVDKPFPFWLYSPSATEYLAGLFRLEALEDLGRRIAYLAGRVRRERPDGYWDYDTDPTWDWHGLERALRENDPVLLRGRPARYPALERLQAALASLPAETALLLVHPPVHPSRLPPPGSDYERDWQACRDATRRLAAARPRTEVADWFVSRPEIAAPENWRDATHYRQPVARAVEADLAARLARMRAP